MSLVYIYSAASRWWPWTTSRGERSLSDTSDRRLRVRAALLNWLRDESFAHNHESTPTPEGVAAHSRWDSDPLTAAELSDAARYLIDRGLVTTGVKTWQPTAALLRITADGERVAESAGGLAAWANQTAATGPHTSYHITGGQGTINFSQNSPHSQQAGNSDGPGEAADERRHSAMMKATIVGIIVAVIGVLVAVLAWAPWRSHAGTALPGTSSITTPSAAVTAPPASTVAAETTTTTTTPVPAKQYLADILPDTPWYVGSADVNGTTYPHSMAGRLSGCIKDSSQVVNLSRKWSQFTAMVGPRDGYDTRSVVQFEVYADDNRIYSSGNVAVGQSVAVTLPVTGVLNLKLRYLFVLGDMGLCSNAGYAVWGDAAVAK